MRRAPEPPAPPSGQPTNSQPSNQTPAPVDAESEKPPRAFPGVLPAEEVENKIAVIKTPKGEIRFELLAAEAPKTTSNFVYLAKQGYFNGLNFHRVESWVIQGGDPNCGSTGSPPSAAGPCGTGGPGYRFEDEPVRLEYKTGIVAMANAGSNTNGSQFFILKQDTSLPPNYTIFGRVTAGQDVVVKIAAGDTMEKVEILSK
ncbi:peptidylprolyl isomerase [Candidatus Parcubacteria bacterium]|nr:peptidylprolyl isomerase [Candidatus Parcubacteria bacterium]